VKAAFVGVPIERNPLLQVMVGVYLALWGLLAISPVDRETWLLENYLVFAAAALLAASHRRFVFSNLSYASIWVFLLLHAVGSHYTYSSVPIGDWARDSFDLSRNHYDRFVHFAFGLLLAYPMREITLRRVHAHRLWSFVVPVLFIVSASSFYEVLEWAAARVTSPDVGMAYVGAQGDVWDGQKDMLLAFTGAVVAMISTALVRRGAGREPYSIGRSRVAGRQARRDAQSNSS
jgi:putative membrane protein